MMVDEGDDDDDGFDDFDFDEEPEDFSSPKLSLKKKNSKSFNKKKKGN